MGFSEDALSRDDFLNGQLRIWQPIHGYRAATDPVLLAAACPAIAGETVLDLGCGVGTAALCLGARIDLQLTGLELQQDYAELAERNAAENDIPLRVIAGDLAEMPLPLREESFDHVILNPPFFGPGKKAKDPGRARGRQEETHLAVWIDSALRRLKQKGWITTILTIERLPEVIVSLNGRAGSISIQPLTSRPGRAASRFILKARKAARGPAKLSNPLILHSGSAHLRDMDDFSEAARAILRDGGSLKF